MECPFHAGNEAITSCAQCDTPICPLCASETNQVLLCLNCYRSRVEELATGLSSASARLAKERKKAEAKLFSKRAKGGVAVETPPVEARPAYSLEATRPLWEREEYGPAGAAEAPAAPAEPAPFVQPPEEAEAPVEAPLSRKELARLRREEAKRLKMERKLAKRAKAETPAAPAEPAPFVQPPEEAEAPVEESRSEPLPFPPDLSLELPMEPKREGVRLPRLEDRLEFLPPLEEKEEELPPGLEPPEGFFD